MKKPVWIIVALSSICLLAIVLFGGLDGMNQSSNLPRKIDYNFHVRPILSDKCYSCHGPDENARKANLRLDIKEGAYAALKESEGLFAIVPGDLKASQLHYRIHAEDSTERMPPPEFKNKLTEREKDILSEWIRQGAEYKPHWAFLLPEKADLPELQGEPWPKSEIDYFVLDKLNEIGLVPNKQANKEHLLKRLSFDLTGLPPSLEMQDRFLADDTPDAFEKVVDELLKSPHYGEKMAIPWLDVARYADSHGYQDDGLRTMWPWRDWVIHAFNENYPYDKFLTLQLAGDLLPNPSTESILATGFNRNHKITQEGGVIDEEYRIEYVTDRTNTFGKAFLGLTFECAKCHDHKYDPISSKEYYGAFAFFNQVPEKGLSGTIDFSFADPPNMKLTQELVEKDLPFIHLPDSMPVDVMVMKDSIGLRDTYVMLRGSYDNQGEQVDFSTPEAILRFDNTYDKNRLGLAKWLLDDSNPLTSRVFVNRVWQELFGRGLVKTVGDFGMQGDFPSHPELLDWLAIDFKEHDWDIKYLVKKIVTSATYRQSSEITEKHLSLDPDNIYLARSSRIRLKAEFIRDHVLASSGLLSDEIGGPSVKPYQPDGLWESATSGRGTLQSYIQDHGKDLYKRGMYTFIKRTVPPPTMLMFDASNRDQCEVRRLNTNTPLQALIMLNDPQVLEASRVLSENLLSEDGTMEQKIQKAFRSIICRYPNSEELEILMTYRDDVLKDFIEKPDQADKFTSVGEYPHRETIENKVEVAALMQIVHTIYNMEEAITKG